MERWNTERRLSYQKDVSAMIMILQVCCDEENVRVDEVSTRHGYKCPRNGYGYAFGPGARFAAPRHGYGGGGGGQV